MKRKKHASAVRRRAFAIWQKLGYSPWGKRKERKTKEKKSGDFYKGAFDSIPFLNEDAKRTFSHLLLRPGYMIRDYIKGAHERYLAPLTALIVFYAFFALVAAVLQPIQHDGPKRPFHVSMSGLEMEDLQEDLEDDSVNQKSQVRLYNLFTNSLFTKTFAFADKGWLYLHLDQFPEEVDTRHEASIAALEGTLRSQGIPLFLSQFFLLWLAMAIALRRYKQGMAAYAAASAYILCQFSFFMLFALLFSFGKSSSIGGLLMLALLVWDYHQWLGIGYRKSLRRALATGINYGILFVSMYILACGVAFLVAWIKA